MYTYYLCQLCYIWYALAAKGFVFHVSQEQNIISWIIPTWSRSIWYQHFPTHSTHTITVSHLCQCLVDYRMPGLLRIRQVAPPAFTIAINNIYDIFFSIHSLLCLASIWQNNFFVFFFSKCNSCLFIISIFF